MQQKSTISYFGGSIGFAALAMIGGYMIHGWIGVYQILILGMLESALSVDNAVLNAKQLNKMSAFWRRAFITVGMLIAVFGMRIVFPIAIVGIATGMNMLPGIGETWNAWFNGGAFTSSNVLMLAIDRPAEYSAALTAHHAMIAGFGGGFLLMVGMAFFFDQDKDTHWMPWIEKPLQLIGKGTQMQSAIALGIVYLLSMGVHNNQGNEFFVAGLMGIITFAVVDFLKAALEKEDEDGEPSKGQVITQTFAAGLAGFIYLEVLDASCSFDGVIGAFAITNNLFVIAMGLGIGAMIVRSLTIMLVDRDTLNQYRFLEHGALYAITSLAGIILASAVIEVPDVIAGFVGMGFLAAAVISSIIWEKRNPEEVDVADSTPMSDKAKDIVAVLNADATEDAAVVLARLRQQRAAFQSPGPQ